MIDNDLQIVQLRRELADVRQAVLHMFTIFTGQRVNEIELRAVIERLGATTRTKVPEGVKL